MLADLLRTDGHRFKPLAPRGDEIRALRAVVRGRDDLVAMRVQLANALRSLLESFWPGAAEVLLGQAPGAVCEPLEMDAKGELARSVGRTLTRLVEQIRLLFSRVEQRA